MRMFRAVCCIVSVLAVTSATAVAEDSKNNRRPSKSMSLTTKAEVGKPAPGFTLKDIEGEEHKLSDYKGKIVVLQWTNYQCPFIKRFEGQKKQPMKVEAKYRGMGVVWLTIDSSHFCKEKSEEIKKFRAEFEPPYPVLLDPSGEVGKLYGAKTTPHVFVVDRDGTIVYEGAPDNEATRDEKPFRFYVDEVLGALVAGKDAPMTKKKPYGCSVKYKS